MKSIRTVFVNLPFILPWGTQDVYFKCKRWYGHAYVREWFIAGRHYHRTSSSTLHNLTNFENNNVSAICDLCAVNDMYANLSAAGTVCMCIVANSKCDSHHGVAGCL